MAKCRVCHRELHDAAAIAAGIGLTCAANVARRQAANELAQRMAYPAEKLARIERMLARIAGWLTEQQAYRAAAYSVGTPEQQELGEWRVRLAIGWYGRWKLMQIRAQKMARTA